MNPYENISHVIENVENILEGLFIKGLGFVPEGTAEDIKKSAEDCERLGLGFAAEALGRLGEALELNRHRMNKDSGDVVKRFCVLGRYIDIVKNRLALEQVRLEMEKKEEEV